MKQRIRKIFAHPLIYGSSILVCGSMVANFLNFLFNVFMSRNLSPADYGTLATIVAFIGFPALAANAIGPVIIRYGGEYFAKGELHKARGLYIKITQVFLAVAAVVCLLLFVFTSQINSFLQIHNVFLLYLTDAIIFFTLISVINIAF